MPICIPRVRCTWYVLVFSMFVCMCIRMSICTAYGVLCKCVCGRKEDALHECNKKDVAAISWPRRTTAAVAASTEAP